MSVASTAAPRRMRAPERLPSRSAATRNGTVASGSSSATQAPDPVRSWNWPGRRRPARRSGNPASNAAPASSGSTASRSKAMPARRAMSAARSRTRLPARSPRRTSSTRIARSADAARSRTMSRSSTRAATTHDSVSGRPTIIRASRGWTGSPSMRRPSDGDRAVAVERAELGQQLARLAPRLGRWAVEERQLVRWRAPGSQLEHQPGEVDLGDLGATVGRTGAVLHPAPQAVRHTRSEAAGATGALVRRVAADRHRGESGHPGADVEARRPGQPAVDDDADTFDRQATSRRCRWRARRGAGRVATARVPDPARRG